MVLVHQVVQHVLIVEIVQQLGQYMIMNFLLAHLMEIMDGQVVDIL